MSPFSQIPNQARAVPLVDESLHVHGAQNQLLAIDGIQSRNSGSVILHACSVLSSATHAQKYLLFFHSFLSPVFMRQGIHWFFA